VARTLLGIVAAATNAAATPCSRRTDPLARAKDMIFLFARDHVGEPFCQQRDREDVRAIGLFLVRQ